MPAADHGHAPSSYLIPPQVIARGRERDSLSPEKKGVLSRQEKIRGQEELVAAVTVFPVNNFFALSLLLSIWWLFLFTPYRVAVPSKLFLSQPEIFAFCAFHGRQEGSEQGHDFSGRTKLGNPILKRQPMETEHHSWS